MRLKIAITGAGGVVGGAILSNLQSHNYDVTGFFYKKGKIQEQCLDLSSSDVSKKTDCNPLSLFDVVIHCAAITKSNNRGFFSASENTNMLENLLLLLSAEQHLIFFSSIDVELLKKYKCTTESTFNLVYAKSKIECEQILLQSKLKRVSILRLAPLYSNDHLEDIAKRVLVPKFSTLKIRLIPSPSYRLCHENIVTSYVKDILNSQYREQFKIYYLNDEKLIKQKELLNYCKGINIVFPLILLRLIFLMLTLFLKFEKIKKVDIMLTKLIGDKNK